MNATIKRIHPHYPESAFKCYATLLDHLFEKQPYALSAAEFFLAFGELPVLSQQILQLKYERGHKFTEISIVLDARVNQITYWFNFGKNNLRRKLNPQYYHKKAGVATLQWVREK